SFSASPSANPAGVRKRMPSRQNSTTLLAATFAAIACLLVPAAAAAQDNTSGGTTGGVAYAPPPHKAKIRNGRAIAPVDAPLAVKAIIDAANKIVEKPYHYGGGHA